MKYILAQILYRINFNVTSYSISNGPFFTKESHSLNPNHLIQKNQIQILVLKIERNDLVLFFHLQVRRAGYPDPTIIMPLQSKVERETTEISCSI